MIFLEREYTIFYGLYIVLNILLIGILLGATNPKTIESIALCPKENVYSLLPIIVDPLNLILMDGKLDFPIFLKNKPKPLQPQNEPLEYAKEGPPKELSRAPIIYSGPSNRRAVAITFDDGPDPRTLQQMLEILDEYNAPATFFLLGHRIRRSENLVRQIYERGHQIANHSYTHPLFSRLGWKEAVREIKKTEEALGSFMSHKYFRPPYGDFKRETLEVAHYLGYRVIYWNVDTRDWAATNPRQIVEAVKQQTRPGSIILFHEGKNLTIQALPEIIRWLRDEGYELLTVAELIGE